MEQVQVTDSATLVDAGVEDDGTAFVCYDVLGWYVELRSESGTTGGPQSVSVSTPHGIPIDGGVTTNVLRAVPLADARKRLDRMKEDHAMADVAAGGLHPFGHLMRVDSEVDLARFAKTYADLVQNGDGQPLKRLVAYTGLSRNTLSARIRRARERGLLTKPKAGNLGSLTSKAENLMADQPGPSGPEHTTAASEGHPDA